MGLADQDQGQILLLVGGRYTGFKVVEQAHAADGRRGQDRLTVGLVVERHIAGDDRKIEGGTGFADPFETADELAHDRGVFRIAEVQAVGDPQRART